MNKGLFHQPGLLRTEAGNVGDSTAKRLAVRKSVSHKNPFMDFFLKSPFVFSLSHFGLKQK